MFVHNPDEEEERMWNPKVPSKTHRSHIGSLSPGGERETQCGTRRFHQKPTDPTLGPSLPVGREKPNVEPEGSTRNPQIPHWVPLSLWGERNPLWNPKVPPKTH